MALNKACVGKHYPPQQTQVTLEAIQKYARAYDDDNPFFFDSRSPGGIIAPPLFGATVVWKSAIQAISDPTIGGDMLRLVHSEHDVTFFRPIYPGDLITSVAAIKAIETTPAGDSMTLELPATNQHGEPVQTTLFTILIRAPRAPRSALRAPQPHPEQAPDYMASYQIAADQTHRYAEASGDFNPIHLDPGVARMAGLPGIIVHGLCTMALCSRAVVAGTCAGDPRRLRRLRVRFSRPVLPGQTITVKIWRAGQQAKDKLYDFETVNPAGQAVIRGGLAQVAG